MDRNLQKRYRDGIWEYGIKVRERQTCMKPMFLIWIALVEGDSGCRNALTWRGWTSLSEFVWLKYRHNVILKKWNWNAKTCGELQLEKWINCTAGWVKCQCGLMESPAHLFPYPCSHGDSTGHAFYTTMRNQFIRRTPVSFKNSSVVVLYWSGITVGTCQTGITKCNENNYIMVGHGVQVIALICQNQGKCG